MYGRTIDDFEYRGVTFRWVLSPNKLIYRVYRESDLIGTIPASQVRLRHSQEAIKALYPICDKWLEAEAAEDAELIPTIETARQEWQEGREERIARKIEEVRESFLAAEAAILAKEPILTENVVAQSVEERKEPKRKGRPKAGKPKGLLRK